VRVAKSLAAISRREGGFESLTAATESMENAGRMLGRTAAGVQYLRLAELVRCLVHLGNWRVAVRVAEPDADRHLRAAQLGARECAQGLTGVSDGASFGAIARAIYEISDPTSIEELARRLLHVPLSLPLAKEELAPRSAVPLLPKSRPETVSVAFVSFSIDGASFGEPQTVEPNMVHDLDIEMRVSRWPDEADELILDPVSVEPSGVCEAPRLSFRRPAEAAPFSLRGCGRMLLTVPQTLSSRPLELAYTARFAPSVSGVQVVVEGQRHLKIQSFDPERNPETGYREIDRSLMMIRDQARRVVRVSDRELADFLQIMAPLGRTSGEAAQDALFKGRWDEARFQGEIRRRLRAAQRIGSELEEHPAAAGGVTDLSFRGIRIELKVSDDSPVDVEVFLGQIAQYVAGSDRRFGVLCILDCSEKTEPLGTVGNDVFLKVLPPPEPSLSGGPPLLIGVVIMRGNLPLPSDLARRGARGGKVC